ncbi:MAG: PilW family protein [Longimicrobiales bacterium]
MRNRPGFTLPDLLVTLVMLGVIGTSLAQVMVVQSRSLGRQEGGTVARRVARSSSNLIFSDLRMIETGNGVVAASPTSITARVPYSMGIVCSDLGGATVVTMAPIDSVVYADALISGYAWRAINGTYTYQEGGSTAVKDATAASKCTDNGITPTAGGSIVKVTPQLPVTALPGTPIFLFTRITYAFSASVALPGHIGLWRTSVAKAQTEELVAPFDSTARFRFYVDGSNTAQDAVPASLSDLRGLELRLTGLNRQVAGFAHDSRAPYTTAVFFKNRM